jgi:hypothetical protein
MRVTLKTINDELARRGATARLAKAAGYFYFQFGEAAEWLDRTVRVPTVSSMSLEQWLGEYGRLKKLNQEIMRGGKTSQGGAVEKPAKKQSSKRSPG